MDTLLITSMALELLLLLALFLLSRGYVLRSFPDRPPEATQNGDPARPWPRAAIVVPLTGNSPEMRGCLQSLLSQDYPVYETVLVTRDPEDPATSLVRELLAHHPRVRHVISGPARTCSQKNHNLLAGLAVLDDAVEILVFCDSNHLAPPRLLRDLIRPLRLGEAVLTTGYRRIIPGDCRLATLGTLQTVLVLQLLQAIPVLSQPWGGATAILRQVFADRGVGRVWSQTVVDDVSLWVHLKQGGIRLQGVPAACLTTHLSGQTLGAWSAWLTRQLQYLKYFLPGTWLASLLAAYLLIVPPLAAALACLGWLVGLVPGKYALVGAVFLALLTGVAAWYRTLVPSKVPLGPWLAAFYATLGVAIFSYLKAWCTQTISWRGISYRVTWGGRVRQIIPRP
jgi:cellulose synthase/poly-beta-1,6-N-acetylglucosamine synthase-like glycosyltransferase